MSELIIEKKKLTDFVKESVVQYMDVMEIEDSEGEVESCDYLIGIDENGEFIYTDNALYIEFSKAVFFIILDQEFIDHIDPHHPPYTSDKEFAYAKELIEAKFKNKYNMIVDIKFV